MSTIKDIAREAGVSISTVSRVLSGHRNVSEATLKKVQEVIERNHFSLNRSASNLKRSSAGNIVLVVVKGLGNIFFASLIEHVQDEIRAKGLSVVIQYIDEDDDEVAAGERLALETKPLGVLFLGGNEAAFCSTSLLGNRYPTVVLTNAVDVGRPGICSVTSDDVGGARQAVSLLLSKGHTRIGVVGGDPTTSTTSALRLHGVREAFSAAGVPFDEERCYVGTRYSLDDGYQATTQLLKADPDLTAVYAFSDVMAIGVMRSLADAGRSVPADVSVVGHDGLEIARYTTPRLTTVKQSQAELAHLGVEKLLALLKGMEISKNKVLAVQIEEGESVANRK
ncbi:MAG: LacI family transcriptional regulator [Propionibacteriaceae bacterium]|jgi:LacI family transcriptional regulator|nr:LacI family transcriptional regulator [Propionibacteriaceae bacterium]